MRMKKLKKAIEIMDLAMRKQKENFDSVFIICGKERVGKSTLMLHLLDYVGGDISCIGLDRVEFVNALVQSKKSGVVCFDEAGDGLLSRDAMSTFNKDLVKAFMVIGGRRLITFFVLPSFFMLDKYFREYRVRGLFFVYRRGKFNYFSPNGISKIINKGDKYIPVYIKDSDSFPDYKGKLLEPYLELKEKKIHSTIEELQKKYKNSVDVKLTKQEKVLMLSQITNLNQKEIAKQVGLSPSYVSLIINPSKSG